PGERPGQTENGGPSRKRYSGYPYHRWLEADLSYRGFQFVLDIDLIARMSILFMVAVSIISAVDYFVAFWSTIDRTSVGRRRSVILSRQRSSEIDVSAGRR